MNEGAPHPYSNLPERQSWRAAVGGIARSAITGLAAPATKIGADDVIGTAGSCFAQHIARNLRERGFNFLDVEPAPELLRPERHNEFGYGMYSARYGNVYTAAQLRQLLERIGGRAQFAEEPWMRGDRFFDPFRPTIEPDGFETREELERDRDAHLRRVRLLFGRIDVFVFTLGLTEAWRSRRGGAVFPIAPGVRGIGRYDPDLYEFVNYGFAAVRADLSYTIKLLRRVNPKLRIILTVSPVPLAATASNDHVLTATTYSKSVLRAVAGELAAEMDFVDYFPSFELITAPVFEGRAYQDDWREVRPEAVARVMEEFFRSFVEPEALMRVKPVETQGRSREDVVCDEAILDSYAASE